MAMVMAIEPLEDSHLRNQLPMIATVVVSEGCTTTGAHSDMDTMDGRGWPPQGGEDKNPRGRAKMKIRGSVRGRAKKKPNLTDPKIQQK